MQSLLMEEILLTSWGWSFIPLFTGQYLIESRISSELGMPQEALRCLEVEWEGGFQEKEKCIILSRWWFQIFVIFTSTWGNDPIWRAYFSHGLKPSTSYSRQFFFSSWALRAMYFLKESTRIPDFFSHGKSSWLGVGQGDKIFGQEPKS